jgi:hypothetical protein
MEQWRDRILWIAFALFMMGFLTGVYVFPQARGALLTLFFSYFLGVVAIFIRNKNQRVRAAKMAIGWLSMLIAVAAVLFVLSIEEYGFFSIDTHWKYVSASLLGIGVAYTSWQGAKPKRIHENMENFSLEEAPKKAMDGQKIDWETLDREWQRMPHRLFHLRSLRRISSLHEQGSTKKELTLVLKQECVRLIQEAKAVEKKEEEGDALSQAARLVEWGIQKIPEIADLDLSDILMAKTIADIQALHTSVETKMVSHHHLLAIHPIDRDTANEKCNKRATAALGALSIIEANNMKLTETLIAAHEELAEFSSVTGFQVVQLDTGYVTFEGNGRREALKRAFPNCEILVEVRVFQFFDSETQSGIQRRVERVRRWKKVSDS